MASVNKVIVLGNLGADPELRYTEANKGVCNMRIATNEKWKDRNGQKQEHTEWHKVTVWGELAENCGKYLEKGRSVYVEGRLQTREYEKDGQKRFSTEIVADKVVFLGGGEGGNQPPKRQPRRAGGMTSDSAPPVGSDDDIPF